MNEGLNFTSPGWLQLENGCSFRLHQLTDNALGQPAREEPIGACFDSLDSFDSLKFALSGLFVIIWTVWTVDSMNFAPCCLCPCLDSFHHGSSWSLFGKS